MTARAIIAPQSFNNATLPQIGVPYIPLIPGAMFDFAADGRAIGSRVDSWPSLISTHALALWSAANTIQSPLVQTDGIRRYLSFDGVNDRLDMDVTISSPFVFVAVMRTTKTAGAVMVSSGGIGPSWSVGTFGDGTQWTFASNTHISPGPTPDTGFHIHLVQANGATSAYTLDGNPTVTGALATTALTHVRVGASTSTYTPTDISRLAIIPGTITDTQRASIMASLKAQYKTP